MNCEFLYTPPSSGAWNMAVDESILEHIHRGEALPTLRLYSWNPPCLSLGHAQSFADVDMERVKAHGWEIVRRLTTDSVIVQEVLLALWGIFWIPFLFLRSLLKSGI